MFFAHNKIKRFSVSHLQQEGMCDQIHDLQKKVNVFLFLNTSYPNRVNQIDFICVMVLCNRSNDSKNLKYHF